MYLLKSKNETFEVFKHYKSKVESPPRKKINAIKSDRGSEYDSPFKQFYSEHRIIH